ncbi:MAG: hypothetical protein HY240_11320, partial [Actinobacteria bacterium]|nr:hypothetical protein [Actinomycetota bacterium]
MARTIGSSLVISLALLGLPSPASAAGPPPGKVYINDVSVTEGNSGTTNATFTISLSPARGSISVDWATAAGTATAGTDFTSASGNVTVSKSAPTVLVSVPVIGDTIDEYDETFFVNLSNASGGAIGDSQGLGTITDDDAPPSLTVNDVTVTEGNSGTTNATFTVALSAASGKTITVSYATADGTAVAPSDYTAASGSL